VDALLSGLQDKADQLTGQQPLLMMLGIFWNNAFASLLALIFGLAAGLFPLFFVMSNGLAIGIVLEMVVAKMGTAGILVFLAGILPHGVIELPAVFISASIGLKLGYQALLSLIKAGRGHRGVSWRGSGSSCSGSCPRCSSPRSSRPSSRAPSSAPFSPAF